MTTKYEVGDKIVLFKRHQEAIIRYIGKTDFAPDKINYGLEFLDDAMGDNNGTVNNIKYFACPKNKGLFVWEKDIKFKIQQRKRTKSFKSNTKPNNKIKKQKSQKKLGPRDMGRNDDYKGIENKVPKVAKKRKKSIKKVENNENISRKRKRSIKKAGPRDVGRNDNYIGITDAPVNKSKTKIKKKKSVKKKKKTVKKNKSIKNEKQTVNTQRQIINGTTNGNVSDSDSYKSGYSGASGHSFDGNDIVIEEINSNENEINENEMLNGSESVHESGSNSESEEVLEEEDTLTKKVMLMMKEKEEQRELEEQRMIEEENKIGIVAMNPRQMDENVKEILEENENENGVDEIVDDDLPEPERSNEIEEVKFKTYAKRKDTVELGEDEVIVKTDTGNKVENINESGKGIDIKYDENEKDENKINGENVNEKDKSVAENKGCCVVL